jgi:DNA-binding CsgD family transcriptional regulator
MMVCVEQVLCPIVVGREGELSRLVELVEAAEAGRRGGAVFLVGEAGVGKSRLARATREAAEDRGCRVLWGRAVAAGTPVPYRPLAEALHSALRGAGPPDAPELRPFLPALGPLVPEWRIDAGHTEDSVVTRGEAVLRLLRVLGRDGGCLLVVEDLQWADADTLAVVEYLADNLAPEPVALVVTLRAESGDALVLAQALRARHVATVVTVAPLGEDLVTSMAEACLGGPAPPDVDAFLRGHADGLPFLVEELLATLVDSSALARSGEGWELRRAPEPAVPLTFIQTVQQRLNALEGDERKVLAAAAVLGRNFDWALLPAVTGFDEQHAVEALKTAVTAQLVAEAAEAPGQFRFRHALTREAVLDSLLSAERQLTARAALAAVRRLHPDLPGEWCQLAADLARQAGDRHGCAELLLELGRRSVDGGAIATGVQVLDEARSTVPEGDDLRWEIDERFVTALAEAGEIERALEVGEALAARMASVGVDARRRATVHLVLATAASDATDWSLARSHVEAAQRLLAAHADDLLTARAEHLAGEIALGEYEVDEAVAHGRQALELADQHDASESACASMLLLGRCARVTDLDESERLVLRALERAEARDLPLWRARALHELATLDVLWVGPPDRLRASQELAESLGLLSVAAFDQYHRAIVHFLRFELDETLELAHLAQAAARRYRLGLLVPATMIMDVSVAGVRLDRRGAEDAADAVLALVGADPELTASTFGHGLALASLAADDRARAREGLETARDAIGDKLLAVAYPWRGVRVLLHALDGDHGALAREERQVVSLLGHPTIRGCIDLAEAVAHGQAGDAPTAVELAERGDESLARTPWFRNVGRRLVAEVMVTDGWGDPVPWLRQAAAFFDGHGNHVLAGACKDLLRDVGAPVPRRGRGSSTVPASLQALGVTSREVDVLALVAQGLSNKEIAARLYLSPRTVEKHVERLVTKTGVAARHELSKYGPELS